MKITRPIRAVLFDMDGVMVDSEFVYMKYLLEFAREKNPAVTMEDINPMVGRSRQDSWMVMERAVDNGESWETLIKEWADRDIYSRIDYRKIFRPEMKTTVQELTRRGYTVALVSSTGPKLISRIVEEVGMRPEFDLIVSGKQFKQSKPNPEIYHYTADTLGIREDECFVVEDSTVGIEAAYRAGMSIAGLKDDRFGFDQSKADCHIDSISDILRYLLFLLKQLSFKNAKTMDRLYKMMLGSKTFALTVTRKNPFQIGCADKIFAIYSKFSYGQRSKCADLLNSYNHTI